MRVNGSKDIERARVHAATATARASPSFAQWGTALMASNDACIRASGGIASGTAKVDTAALTGGDMWVRYAVVQPHSSCSVTALLLISLNHTETVLRCFTSTTRSNSLANTLLCARVFTVEGREAAWCRDSDLHRVARAWRFAAVWSGWQRLHVSAIQVRRAPRPPVPRTYTMHAAPRSPL